MSSTLVAITAASSFGGAAFLIAAVARPAIDSAKQTLVAKLSTTQVTRPIASRIDALGPVSGSNEHIAQLLRSQLLFAGVTAVVTAMLMISSPSATSILAGGVAIAGSWQLPLIRARRIETERLASVDRELTNALGEIVMGVEAGLTFEAVLNHYAQRHDTPLGNEFTHMSQLLQAGRTRRQVIDELSRRNPTPIIRSFSAAIDQNQTLGTPLAAVLRKQAETTRRHRRQAAETRAAAVSMKMIFPTVFCILPLLMIVVVGPAIVRLMEVL
ncbi:MAG: type II secretion system F family protein [Ilumatobacteraceae bacterium]